MTSAAVSANFIHRAAPLPDWTDARLARRAADGHRDAFAELCRRHEPRALRICRTITGCPEDAADATQEALLAVMRRLPHLAGRELDFEAYLAVAARHAAYAVCRRRTRRRSHEDTGDALTDGVVDPALSPEAALLREEDGAAVRAAVRALPTRHQTVLVLRHVCELGHDEVVEVMGGNANSSAQLLLRARRGLEKQLALAA